MTKQEMRSFYLARRKSQPEEERQRADSIICKSVLSLRQMEMCKTVMVYVSFGAEVDTHALTEQLIAQGKKLCAPLCDQLNCSMKPYGFEGISSLHKGAYGILEPVPEKEIEPSELDAVIVPGCVFGRNFHRIGYGKGYYDRFLQQIPHVLKIGLCYDCCFTQRVEAEPMDTAVDIIVTEREILQAR